LAPSLVRVLRKRYQLACAG